MIASIRLALRCSSSEKGKECVLGRFDKRHHDAQEVEVTADPVEADRFHAFLQVPLSHESRAEALFALLGMMRGIARGHWTIDEPSVTGDCVFECILNNYLEGDPIEWAHVTLETTSS